MRISYSGSRFLKPSGSLLADFRPCTVLQAPAPASSSPAASYSPISDQAPASSSPAAKHFLHPTHIHAWRKGGINDWSAPRRHMLRPFSMSHAFALQPQA
ncbi:hypothetical protein CVT26_001132 [Gymnopilus dilepis]|uniref:Uncharacterized protein n=1 Tax=Gymnopilus dilepis TaxID=231916 RepID=A0A409WBH5_9AGAR|nr:hypothetical protein CVT26_001132 [Gymnopilus dilepis]